MLLFLVPLLLLIILNLPSKGIFRKAAFYLVSLIFILQMCLVVSHPSALWNIGHEPFKPFFAFNFSIDNLSMVMLLIISIVELASLIVGNFIIQDENKKFNFINLLLISFIGMNGMVMVSDLFVLYVFLEITAIASFVLIAIKKDIFGLEGAFKYLLLSAISSVLMLSSLALILLYAGSVSFPSIALAAMAAPTSFYIKLSVALFLCGLFIKSGLMPFHAWLPDAYSGAPTYISILLAGVVTKVSGVYVLIRIMLSAFGFNPSISNAIMFVGALSIVFGAVSALSQTNFKRMLAYSSISQVGYIVLALGCGTPIAILGAVFHMFNHAIFKSLLFVNAACVEERTGTMDMDKMGGLAQKMPVTGITSVIAFLSTAGVPPLSGFWSKIIIIIALFVSGNYIYSVIALLASVLTLAYFLTMQRKVFFGAIAPEMEGVKEAQTPLLIPALLLAAVTVFVGLFFPFVLQNFLIQVNGIMMVVR